MPQLNAVIDLSHFNSTVDLTAAKADGILGVIHKATQGLTFRDPTYQAHRQLANGAGLLWGAYHFGIGGDGVSQAEYFLNFAQPGPNDLLVLDLEENTQGATMTLDEARAFVTHIQQARGVWPGLYGGSLIKQLLGTSTDPVLANCWLWVAQYASTPIIPANWSTWTLWQYTDGTNGPAPHEVAGIGNCDRDIFNGTSDGLQVFWSPPVSIAATVT